MTLEELKEERKNVELKILKLGELIVELNKPKGYKEVTSYQDFDGIHGDKPPCDIIYYCQEHTKLQNVLSLLDYLIENYSSLDESNMLKMLGNNTLGKIKYLRFVRGYTQEEVAKMLNKSISTIYRAEKLLAQNEDKNI